MSKQKLMEVLYPVWVWCRRKSYLVSSVDTCEFELMNFTWYHCRFITTKGIYYQMNFYIPLGKRPSGISISWLASRRKRHWVGLFSTEFFFLVVLRGGRPYIVIGMIAVARLWLPVPSVFCWLFVFVNGLIMFHMFASFLWTTEYTGLVRVTIESDRGSKSSAG